MSDKPYKPMFVFQDSAWDKLVTDTYNKLYAFQQQEGCRERGHVRFSVPWDAAYLTDYLNDSIPIEVNGATMGVKFEVWKKTPRDYPEVLSKFDHQLFWHRNYYPDHEVIAQDLYEKGLLEAGEYMIVIDW